jgi:hypothetical protein
MNDQLSNLPSGNGHMARLLRDLDRRIRRIEPRETLGLLRQGSRNGINLKPHSLAGNGNSSGGDTTPRYR